MVKQPKTGSNLLAWGRVCVQAFREIERRVDCVFLPFLWDALWVVPCSLKWPTEKTAVETYTTYSRMKSSFLWHTLNSTLSPDFCCPPWLCWALQMQKLTCSCVAANPVPATTSRTHTRYLKFTAGPINEMNKLWSLLRYIPWPKGWQFATKDAYTYSYWDTRLLKQRGQRR